MSSLTEKLEKQKEILEAQGYTVCYLSVYGSQNYGLDIYTDEYKSDIDMKAIIVPTLDDLIYNSKPISKVIDTEWGQCDLKDIRSYFQTLLKANPAYIETLYTDYYIVDSKFENEFNEIFKLRDTLVDTLKAQMLRAMYGMMCEKEKALCHPYPSIKDKIEKFGYCGKQGHHIYRLWLMMTDYYRHGKALTECFKPSDKGQLRILENFKLNKYSLDEAKQMVNYFMGKAKEFKDDILSNIDESVIDYSVKDKFLKLSQDIIKNKIIEECKSL